MATQVEARPPPPPTGMPHAGAPIDSSQFGSGLDHTLGHLQNGDSHTVEPEHFNPDEFVKDEGFNPDEFLEMSPCTPSPTASGPTSSSANANSKRPPRKSTLTQQQKNQKRQRATQDQLATLEVEFNKNPTPTAPVRERIASEINMTERSVQIWFQNRRAKIKNLAKKSIETGEDCDAIPESMRKYLALQAMESGKPFLREVMGNGMFTPYGNGLLLNADSNTSKTVITHFACNSLTIGSWRRIGQTALDLVVFYSPAKSIITYYINADASGYKIEYPFSYIKNITLDSGDLSASAEGANQPSGGLVVELNRPPHFQMDHSKAGFYPCRDFTENQQASQVLVHHLGGHPKVLSGQLAKLVSLESFRNRHRQPDANPMAASAPVSPIGMRPASQPNHLTHPHMNQPLYPATPFEMGPPAPPRGHKRQRSRSVPIAMDFTQLRQQPMPHFQMPQYNFQQPPPQQQLQAPQMQAPMLSPHPPPHPTQQQHLQQPQPQPQQHSAPPPPPQQAQQQQSPQPQQPQHHQPAPPQQPQQQQQQQQQQLAPPQQTPTPQPAASATNGQPPIYAPVPQHHHQGFGPVGPTLRIDISSGYSFDFRHAHPMSATPGAQTTTTEGETPIFSSALPQEPFSAPAHQATFGGPFLSPQVDPSHLAVSSAASPLSTMSHPGNNEPFIVNQSPPLTGFDRSPAGGDTYPTPDETSHESYLDAGTGLADQWGEYDLFSKQHFSLPFRASGEMTPKEEFEFQDMIDFNEPLSLSPDNSFSAVSGNEISDPATSQPQTT